MNSRRKFLRNVAAGVGVLATAAGSRMQAAGESDAAPPGGKASGAREYWVQTLCKVVTPVLSNIAEDRLHERMPVECAPGQKDNRRTVTHLEAFGRTLSGIAPWLELPGKSATEAELCERCAKWARQGLDHATDPNARDYMNFAKGGQPLVDSAFLAHALIRARNELWDKSDTGVRKRLIDALQSTRKIKPGNNNWLLFSAMVETFLASVGAEWRPEAIDVALTRHQEWYKGDGVYGDGADFHWDYYNSFVIQPFLIDILEHIGQVTPRWSHLLPDVLLRARRYAAIQERMIGVDGSFPAIGRSLAYRCGAFQLLAQMAMRKQLPDGLSLAQVRCALSAVIRRTMEAPGTFDPEGWLQIGLCGHQPALGEGYISTGSTYLCAVAFLPLGLPPQDAFWAEPAADWTSKKIWSGQNLAADHAL